MKKTPGDIDGAEPAILSQWGASEFYMPHGITFVAGNHPVVWMTDVGLHQIFKIGVSATGRGLQRLLTLGTRLKPGKGKNQFCKPTSVAVDENTGMVYIADG